ncbi:hypothetical protein [Fodinicola feengrottensis]|uniref:hypothetical protein n=1 Tax=Fodinicola feengrottensis TaxID=435914 RepID=UPI00244299F5|nr:hypothetical protein [Fodinicola feengrottensis]
MWRWRHGPARERQVVEAFAVFAEDPSGGGYEERLLGALRRATVPAGGPDPEFRRQLRSQLTALAAAPVRRRYPRIAMMAVAVAVAMLGTAAVTIDRDGASAFALQRQAEAAELALAPLTPRAAAQLHLSLASSGLRALRAVRTPPRSSRWPGDRGRAGRRRRLDPCSRSHPRGGGRAGPRRSGSAGHHRRVHRRAAGRARRPRPRAAGRAGRRRQAI